MPEGCSFNKYYITKSRLHIVNKASKQNKLSQRSAKK